MKRIRISTLIAVALLAISSIASASSYVKVTGSSGESVYFAVADKPTVTFTTSELVITTPDKIINYPLTDYRKFEFADETTSIESVSKNAQSATFSIEGDALSCSGLQPGSMVRLYSTDGRMTGMATVASDGTARVALKGTSGMTIVKTSNKSFKFTTTQK